MLTRQRKDLILERLARDGRVVAKPLADELALSVDTIRRDLRELARAGRLQRVHGGALPCAPADGDLVTRGRIASASKRAVGRTAAGLVRPGQVVILDGGTTALEVVAHLPRDLAATVVTHSPPVAVALAGHAAVRVVTIGGSLYRHSMVAVGAAAVEAASRVRANCFLMGVTGIDPEAGLSTGDLEEAHVKRALARRAAETIVLASAEKLNVASSYVVSGLDEIDGVVVDDRAPDAFVAAMRAASLEVYRDGEPSASVDDREKRRVREGS